MSCCPENNITPIPCVEDAAQLLLDKLDLQKVITDTEKNIATLPPELKANAQKGLDGTKAMQSLLLAMADCNYCCLAGSSGSQLQYKEFTYTGDALTKQEIWTDITKTIQLYSIDYFYTGDNLTSQIVTNTIDLSVITKVYSYDIDDNLISINIT